MKTPISELPQELSETDRLAWQLPIHEGACNPSSLLVDTRQLALNARLGGLSGIIVRGYQGEASDYTVNATSIEGVANDGTAAGSAAVSARKAEVVRQSLSYGEGPVLSRDYRWPVATIAINRTELGSRIATRRNAGASEAHAWASELNRSLRRGTIKAAAQNLIGDLTTPEACGFPLFPVTMVMSLAAINQMFAGEAPILIPAVTGFALGQGSYTSFCSMGYWKLYGKSMIERKRWSIFPNAVHPDRFVLSAIAASVKPIVQPARRQQEQSNTH